MDYTFVSVNTNSVYIFLGYTILPVERMTYPIAEIHYLQRELRIKRGEIEIELKNVDLPIDDVIDMLLKLEQKS